MFEVHGHKLFLNKPFLPYYSWVRWWKILKMEACWNDIIAGNVVVNVAASVGYYTPVFAKLVEKNWMVFAFEPDPDNFALLKKNTELRLSKFYIGK